MREYTIRFKEVGGWLNPYSKRDADKLREIGGLSQYTEGEKEKLFSLARQRRIKVKVYYPHTQVWENFVDMFEYTQTPAPKVSTGFIIVERGESIADAMAAHFEPYGSVSQAMASVPANYDAMYEIFEVTFKKVK